MQVVSLYSQCMETLIQNISWNANRFIVLEQMKQPGLVQVFSSRVLNKLVEWNPLSVTDDVLDTISNKNLLNCSLKRCTRVTVDSFLGFLDRYVVLLLNVLFNVFKFPCTRVSTCLLLSLLHSATLAG